MSPSTDIYCSMQHPSTYILRDESWRIQSGWYSPYSPPLLSLKMTAIRFVLTACSSLDKAEHKKTQTESQDAINPESSTTCQIIWMVPWPVASTTYLKSFHRNWKTCFISVPLSESSTFSLPTSWQQNPKSLTRQGLWHAQKSGDVSNRSGIQPAKHIDMMWNLRGHPLVDAGFY